MSDIEDILNDVEPKPTPAEEDPKPQDLDPEKKEDPKPAEDPRVSETGDKKETDLPPKSGDNEAWTKELALDERAKRQKLEAEFEAYKSEHEKKEPEKALDPWADTEAWQNHLDKQRQQDRFAMSVQMVKLVKPDYEEKEAIFLEMMKENPVLRDQINKAENPALFAYQTAEKKQALDEIGDADEYKSKLRAEIEAEVRKEFEDKANNDDDKEPIEPSLAKESSSGSVSGASWNGPTPLDEIIPN